MGHFGVRMVRRMVRGGGGLLVWAVWARGVSIGG